MKLPHPFDFTGANDVNWSNSHPDAAADALMLVAGYLRRHEAVPSELARYLADAIEASMSKPNKIRAKVFTNNLHLTGNNRRPAGYWYDIGRDADNLIDDGKKQADAFSEIAEKYNSYPQMRISEETVKKYWREYRAALKIDREISNAEMYER